MTSRSKNAPTLLTGIPEEEGSEHGGDQSSAGRASVRFQSGAMALESLIGNGSANGGAQGKVETAAATPAVATKPQASLEVHPPTPPPPPPVQRSASLQARPASGNASRDWSFPAFGSKPAATAPAPAQQAAAQQAATGGYPWLGSNPQLQETLSMASDQARTSSVLMHQESMPAEAQRGSNAVQPLPTAMSLRAGGIQQDEALLRDLQAVWANHQKLYDMIAELKGVARCTMHELIHPSAQLHQLVLFW